MDLLNTIVGILGLLLGIFSMLYAFKTTRIFSRGVKFSALNQIRTLINRMENAKKEQTANPTAYNAMQHTQEDLETLFKNLQTIFEISDKDARRYLK